MAADPRSDALIQSAPGEAVAVPVVRQVIDLDRRRAEKAEQRLEFALARNTKLHTEIAALRREAVIDDKRIDRLRAENWQLARRYHFVSGVALVLAIVTALLAAALVLGWLWGL